MKKTVALICLVSYLTCGCVSLPVYRGEQQSVEENQVYDEIDLGAVGSAIGMGFVGACIGTLIGITGFYGNSQKPSPLGIGLVICGAVGGTALGYEVGKKKNDEPVHKSGRYNR